MYPYESNIFLSLNFYVFCFIYLMSPTKHYLTPCCLCIASPQVRMEKMVVFDHLRETSKVGLIALEKKRASDLQNFLPP